MQRRRFLEMSSSAFAGLIFNQNSWAMSKNISPNVYHFSDDGLIPNNKLPLLIYPNAFPKRGTVGAEWLEQHFGENAWTNTWRWGVYPFHHYHSNTHEVLGVFQGSALLHMGGESGKKLKVNAGDIIVIPAGVGHKCLTHSEDFTVVGAYPFGLSPDLNKGEKGERSNTDRNISAVKLPITDPFFGKKEGLMSLWKNQTI